MEKTIETSLAAASNTADHVASSAHKVVDKVSDAARPAVSRIAAGAHQAVDKLADAATKAADTLEAKGGQLKDVQSRLTESCRVQVRENPLRTLGIAVAAGFLLSWLIKQR